MIGTIRLVFSSCTAFSNNPAITSSGQPVLFLLWTGHSAVLYCTGHTAVD